MNRRYAVMSRERVLTGALALALLASVIPISAASAANSLVAATGGTGISNDTTTAAGGTGTYTTLTGPVVNGTAGTLDAGTITFTIDDPAEFEFNTGSGSVALTPGAAGECGTLAPTAGDPVVTASTVTVTLTGDSTGACTLTYSDLQVRPKLATAPQSSNITATSTLAGVPGSAGTLSTVPGAAILTFTPGPPASNIAGEAFAPPVTVHSEDQFGNDRVGDPITLSIQPGSGTAGAVVSNCATNPTATDGTGDADFTGCRIDTAGTNYQLRATNGSSVGVSTFFNVTAAAPASLAFLAYPAGSTPALLTPQPSVAVVDAFGNVVTTDTRSIMLSISANAGTFSCTGGLTKAAVAGVAQFSGCQQSTVANGYTLTASDGPGGVPNITGAPFNVTSGPASKLAICWNATLPCSTTPPASVNGGAAGSLNVTVRVQDVAGNQVPNDNTTTVTLAIAPSSPTSGGPGTLSCTGGTSKVVASGVAQFSCSIDRAGSNYRLVATSSPALTSATSNAFNVVVGPPVRLAFVTQPANVSAGAAFPTSIQLAIVDLGGNVVTTGIVATVALSIGTNPGAGTLTCANGTSLATASGVATFTGCRINNQGSGYTLVGTATSSTPSTTLTPATSNPFNVIAPLAQITLITPSPVITWGSTVVFSIQFGANGANKAFTMQASPDGVTWATIITPPLMTNGSGQGSFAYRPARNLYYRAVFGGTPDLAAGMSNVQRVVVRQIALLRPTNLGAVDHIAVGTTIRFTTKVRPARPELPRATVTFVVYRLVGRTWTQAASRDVVIDGDGLAVVDVTFSQTGRWYVRSIARPTSANANSVWGPVERYDVP